MLQDGTLSRHKGNSPCVLEWSALEKGAGLNDAHGSLPTWCGLCLYDCRAMRPSLKRSDGELPVLLLQGDPNEKGEECPYGHELTEIMKMKW